jgi:hypothetical protein
MSLHRISTVPTQPSLPRHSSFDMFGDVNNVRSLAMPAIRLNGLILTIFLILSLIADGAAQSSSQIPSAVSRAASQTPAQPVSQVSESTIPSGTGNGVSYPDDSCENDHRDQIEQALEDTKGMVKITAEGDIDLKNDPGFWQLFGQRATGNITAIKNVFTEAHQMSWSISAFCNFDDSDPCNDPSMYGGIAKTAADTINQDGTQGDLPQLTFCREFFALPSLDHRVQMGINHPNFLQARYSLGYFHANQGELHGTILWQVY